MPAANVAVVVAAIGAAIAHVVAVIFADATVVLAVDSILIRQVDWVGSRGIVWWRNELWCWLVLPLLRCAGLVGKWPCCGGLKA